jgi:hypothetical protein
MFNIAGTPSQTPAPAVVPDSGSTSASGAAAQLGTPAEHTGEAPAPKKGVSDTVKPADLQKIRPGKASSGEEWHQLLPLREQPRYINEGATREIFRKEIMPIDPRTLPGSGAPMDDLP